MNALFPLPLLLIFPALVGCGESRPGGEGEGAVVERPRNLRLVSNQSPSTPIIGEQIVWFADSVNSMADGRLRIKVFGPDELVGAMEVLDVVASGKVEAGYASSGFWGGKMPAAPLFSAVPFGPDTAEYLSWFYHGNGMELYQEMYDRHGFEVKVLICGIIPPETSGWFAQRIESVEDLQGLKMRFFGLGGEVMERLGVGVRILPPGEIYPALEKGVIDATEFSVPSIDERLGFYKIVDYNYFPGWHQRCTILELLIHKPVWNELSESQRSIIENAARANIIRGLVFGEGNQGAAMKRNEERGVRQELWSDEMLEVFERTWNELAAEKAAEDEFFRKVWEDLQAYRREYAEWESKANLR